ncbi:hypothetical protein N9D14_02750 [Candidatus Pelagibacter sp.]|jgi:hypothetical protein|nr:hypothetical protein [Candidatus Pelagibacter sp.]
MIKKIILTLLLCFLIVSCGKKGDPEYKDPEKKTKIQTILKNKA